MGEGDVQALAAAQLGIAGGCPGILLSPLRRGDDVHGRLDDVRSGCEVARWRFWAKPVVRKEDVDALDGHISTVTVQPVCVRVLGAKARQLGDMY